MNRLWRRADDLVTGLATMIRPGRCICAIAAAAAVGSVAAFDASASQLFKRFGDGTHAVGRDVAPGTYRTSGRNGCYWARLRSFNGSLSAIIANDNAVGPAVVTIARKDKGFETRGCGTWTSNLARITKSKTRFGQGTFIIGTDIAPGTYRARGTGVIGRDSGRLAET